MFSLISRVMMNQKFIWTRSKNSYRLKCMLFFFNKTQIEVSSIYKVLSIHSNTKLSVNLTWWSFPLWTRRWTSWILWWWTSEWRWRASSHHLIIKCLKSSQAKISITFLTWLTILILYVCFLLISQYLRHMVID